VRTPTSMSKFVGDPPKTKLPSGVEYRYSGPTIIAVLEFGNDTANALLLTLYFTSGMVWLVAVELVV
jgi:hypothetical protein